MKLTQEQAAAIQEAYWAAHHTRVNITGDAEIEYYRVLSAFKADLMDLIVRYS